MTKWFLPGGGGGVKTLKYRRSIRAALRHLGIMKEVSVSFELERILIVKNV
jgi:hypothetical protein